MPLNVNALTQAETKRSVYRITCTADQTPEALLEPEFWVHVARNLRIDDRVEVIAHDRSWFGELTVLEVGKVGGARVAYILGPVELKNDGKVEQPAEYVVRWGGPNAKWQVVRSKDKVVVVDQKETKDEAGLAMAEFLKAAA